LLATSVSDALPLFAGHAAIQSRLATLESVGLGYLTLGQPLNTLSGGESQRLKLVHYLSGFAADRKTDAGVAKQAGALLLLDEPTTGLHFDDVRKLLDVLQRLTDLGNTVVVIEHNLDVMKAADWIIDLGPDGGEYGGRIVASGTPEQVARHKKSYTAEALRKVMP
ncbi:MAG TPA: hypothetical protein VLI90_06705, partial [Tepidisphaeraceae bacterium]|nr:hypothetical protein [Tepidisphaeraceae bacterium]